ncbi:MAG: CRISPR-associated endonuclease Cas3'', partial [Calditrichaeota bacterium]
MNDQQFNRNAILAKSPPGQRSLFDHLQDCLGIFKQLKIALPALPRCAGDTFFWDMLFLAVYLHDWGKACSGFQQQLQPDGKRWGERHERFSAAFVALASLDERKQQQVGRAILGHHKTFDKLRELRIRIKAQEDGILDLDFIRAETSFAQQIEDIDKNYIRFLKNQLPDVSMRFHPQNRIQTQTIQFSQLQDPLDILLDFWLKKAPESHSQVFWLEMLLCGATKMCDHLGSARMENIPVLTQDDFQFMQRIQPYVHQKNCWQTTGHAFLTAPTGSGKTEAALGWIQLQLAREQGRVFYILPYTASINAMQQRLAQILTPEQSFESSEL